MTKQEFDEIIESVCDKFRVQPEMRAFSENEKYKLRALFDAEVDVVNEKYKASKVVKKAAKA